MVIDICLGLLCCVMFVLGKAFMLYLRLELLDYEFLEILSACILLMIIITIVGMIDMFKENRK